MDSVFEEYDAMMANNSATTDDSTLNLIDQPDEELRELLLYKPPGIEGWKRIQINNIWVYEYVEKPKKPNYTWNTNTEEWIIK